MAHLNGIWGREDDSAPSSLGVLQSTKGTVISSVSCELRVDADDLLYIRLYSSANFLVFFSLNVMC